jgi:hypothetical protein
MGTRSKTFIVEDNNQVEAGDYTNCIAMYRQYDGYPDGHGLELAEFLQPFTIVNGIRLGETRKIANGLSCLAAQMIAHFKEDAGEIYLSANKYVDGLDYHYVIYENEKTLKMQCWNTGYKSYDGSIEDKDTLLFEGTPEEYIEWVNINTGNND